MGNWCYNLYKWSCFSQLITRFFLGPLCSQVAAVLFHTKDKRGQGCMLLGLAEAQLAKALAGEAIRTLVEASWEV